MKKYLGIILLIMVAGAANAQDFLKGTVLEAGNNNKIPEVFIKDVNNNQLGLSDKDGKFLVRTAVGHLLVFSAPGYGSDTLYVYDMKPKKVQLKLLGIALREVDIASGKEKFDPKAEYPEVYEKSKVYVMSPSTWFSEEGKQARRLKRYFATEEQERHVDEVFTRAYVGSLVPLKGQDLDNFIELYRPTYAFLRNNNGPSLAAYVNDSYKKYLALPPEKRMLQRLTSQ